MRKVLTTLVDFIFYIIVILIVVALLFVLSYAIYFQSSLTKVISGYPGMGDVRIEFDRIDTDIISNYPYGHFVLKNFKVIDGSDSEVDHHIININQVLFDIKNSTWKDKRLLVNDIRLDSGEIFIHRDSLGHYNFNELFNLSKSKSRSNGIDHKNWSIDTDSVQVKLNEMIVSYKDYDKHQSIVTSIKHGKVDMYQNNDGSRLISTDLDLEVIDFTLMVENGSFLKGANVKGPVDVMIDDNGLHIDETLLKVNEQQILASAEFFKNKEKYSYIHLINRSTDFEAIKPLLTPSLQTILEPYRAEGFFVADARLTIMPSHPLRVDIDYVFPGNDLYIANQVYYNTKMSGHFVNDKVYDKSYNKVITEVGGIRFDIERAETVSNSADILLSQAVILSSIGHPATINSDAYITGATELISDQLKNDKFLFYDGTFSIDAALRGQLNKFEDMIEKSDINLTITDCDVQYLPSQVVLPVQSFYLNKKSGDAEFNVTGLTADDVYDLNLEGSVTNLMSLLYEYQENQSVTNVNLKAKRLSWEDFIYILGEGFNNKIEKTDNDKRKDMKKTLRGFQNHFQPNININIDSSGYYDYISMENIVAHMHFPEENLLVVDSAFFNLEEGHFRFDCKIDISSDEITPFEIYCNAVDINLNKIVPSFDFFGIESLRNLNFLPKDFDIKMRLNGIINDTSGIVGKSLSGDITFNSTKRRVAYAHINFDQVDSYDSIENRIKEELNTTIKIRGNPIVFNSYFDNDQFFFNEGDFELDINHKGENFSIVNLISEGDIRMTIDSSYVHYDPLSVTFPLTHIDLAIEDNDAIYNFLMRSDSLNPEIKFDGTVQNISEIIVEDTGDQVYTTGRIFSPRITWNNFIDIFDIDTTYATNGSQYIQSAPVTSTSKLCALLYRFSPDLTIRFDTIEYNSDLFINNFNSTLSLADSVFHISDTQFDYRDGAVSLDSEIVMSDDIDSILTRLRVDGIDINNFIDDLDLLTHNDLSKYNYISGIGGFDIDFSQHYENINQLRDTITEAEIGFYFNDLIIDDAPWLNTIGRKLLHPNRFKKVKFAPISGNLTLRNDSIHIPLIELQSNAFDLFVEGHYHRDNPNIWLSLPLYNIKERDLSIIPRLEGYGRRKFKLHLEYAIHKDTEPSFKLRLSKRKFYKDRGLLAQWKKMRKSRK